MSKLLMKLLQITLPLILTIQYPSDIQDIYKDTEEYLSEEEDNKTDSESDSSDED